MIQLQFNCLVFIFKRDLDLERISWLQKTKTNKVTMTFFCTSQNVFAFKQNIFHLTSFFSSKCSSIVFFIFFCFHEMFLQWTIGATVDKTVQEAQCWSDLYIQTFSTSKSELKLSQVENQVHRDDGRPEEAFFFLGHDCRVRPLFTDAQATNNQSKNEF